MITQNNGTQRRQPATTVGRQRTALMSGAVCHGGWLRYAPLLLLLVVRPLSACNIPVYKYALDLWPADPYEAIVVHRDEPAALTLLQDWRKLAAAGGVNVVVRDAHPGQEDGPVAEWLLDNPVSQTPWLALRYPVRADARQPLWSGPLDAPQANAWLDSPMRQRIAQHLQKGSAGVWLLLGGGQRGRDDDAFALLNRELDRLERVLHLRDAGAADDAAAGDRPAFARLFLDRNDAGEAALVAMLLHSEPGLTEITGQPLVFPIYGRGIILYALAGAGINVANITAASEFLVGDCSCEVKSGNPGIELLLSAIWDDQPAGTFADFDARGERAAVQLEDIRGVIPSAALHDEKAAAATASTAVVSAAIAMAPTAAPRKPRWPWIVAIALLSMGAVFLVSSRKGAKDK